MNQSQLTKEELAEAMVSAAEACLKSFGQSHSNKVYCAFAIETYANYGYYHMALNTHEDFEEYATKCREMGIPERDIEEEKWANPQSWKCFSFNDNVQDWNENWKETEAKIQHTLECLDDEYDEQEFLKFTETFKNAGIESCTFPYSSDGYRAVIQICVISIN